MMSKYHSHFLTAWTTSKECKHVLEPPAFAPIYAPGRCSIRFHPLHTMPAIVIYGLLLVPGRTRLLGLGLLIYISLDALDCWLM